MADAAVAAHIAMLAAVTGEPSVVTLRDARRYRYELANLTWRQLLATVANQIECAMEPGEPQTMVSWSNGPVRDPVGFADGVVLHVYWSERGSELWLSVRYRAAAVSVDYAGRVAGYHVAALELMCRDPDSAHHRGCLLSEWEIRTQLHEFSGRCAAIPDASFAELLSEQVRLHGAEVAARYRQQQLTYQELDMCSNRVAHALLGRGLDAEDVVAVAMRRSVDWLAATLGVIKAGGVYLPVSPDFPADRILTQLRQSGCRFVLRDSASTAALDTTMDGMADACQQLRATEIIRGSYPADDPRIPVTHSQLAYIFFTSGSTGVPKGAMLEHAGMLNHLCSKVEDLELRAGDVIAQTASQCFDISLWQLVAPLMVGGSTLIVDDETLHDIGPFVERVLAGGVAVTQLVPSYLEVVISELERRPRSLRRLRAVLVTGEALPVDLVRRWFAVQPEIKLINAYGATEVCDDTMLEFMDGPRDRDFVAVGRSLRNVHTYVMSEDSRLVPLGSPGEIVFSGVCVGRGYINDDERTDQVFVPDPYRPGYRMYRTGDFGRWLPDGRMEYLGRRDQQVKVRGFRVELREIEARLRAVEGVQAAAVVLDDHEPGNTRLVAFYSGMQPPAEQSVREALAEFLPDYLIPDTIRRLATLPLNENGKIDRRELVRLIRAAGTTMEASVEAPATATERRLAVLWAELLGISLERIGRSKNFFDLGATSLATVRLLVRLDRVISLKEIASHPTLERLAAVIDSRSGTG